MSHSKRNTSLAFFTSHERGLLRSTWGSQSTRLNRDSFLPFAACLLCLLPAQDPVACSGCVAPITTSNNSTSTIVQQQDTTNGSGNRKRKRQRKQCHVFCRECIVSNLLAQKKELKRLEGMSVVQRAEAEEAEQRAEEEAKVRAVQDFEQVQAGLEVKLGRVTTGDMVGATRRNIVGRENGKIVIEEEVMEGEKGKEMGMKRKFELDEDELLRIAQEERAGARKKLDLEKESSRKAVPSFWLPSNNESASAPTTTPSTLIHKIGPICPGSSSSTPHSISLKSLITINFTSDANNKDKNSRDTSATTSSAESGKTWTCPACSRSLTNASSAVLATLCGHAVCGQCADKFMSTSETLDPHAAEVESAETPTCFVCGVSIGGTGGNDKLSKTDDTGRHKSKHKDNGRVGELLEISCEGTGFAGGGKNVVTRKGVAFQC